MNSTRRLVSPSSNSTPYSSSGLAVLGVISVAIGRGCLRGETAVNCSGGGLFGVCFAFVCFCRGSSGGGLYGLVMVVAVIVAVVVVEGVVYGLVMVVVAVVVDSSGSNGGNSR